MYTTYIYIYIIILYGKLLKAREEGKLVGKVYKIVIKSDETSGF